VGAPGPVGKVRPAVARARLLITLVVILVLTVSPVGLARKLDSSSQSVSDTPRNAGVPAALSLRTTFDRSTHGELTGVELDLARGFRFDSRAADTCSDSQARAGRCPQTSTIGRGTGKIVVQGRYLPRTPYAVGATFYLAKPRRPGDIAGVVLDLYETQSKLHATLLGRVVALGGGPYGIALRFSGADTELPSGYDLSVLALTTVLQAHREIYNLLTNPDSCPRQGWPVRLLIESGGHPQVFDSNAACSG
jgi:hypothetical protein